MDYFTILLYIKEKAQKTFNSDPVYWPLQQNSYLLHEIFATSLFRDFEVRIFCDT